MGSIIWDADDVLVDDGEENLSQAREAGLQTVAWPQPWHGSTQDATETLLEFTRKAR